MQTAPHRLIEGHDAQAWLCECHGFRVDAPQGRIGFVEEVLAEDDDSPPAALVIRIGRLGRRQVPIGVGQVAEVVPREGRLVLSDAPQIAEPLLVSRLRPLRRTYDPTHA
jgi:hypothetical protein